ncbi:MAG: histidine phosphatase family protein [Candidatus Eremiobacteraeota bacterium]|nr:histidine phosphatase family protein [Candidatus Eremiobacteraeota bacterium]
MPTWPEELYLITHAECDAGSGVSNREAGLTLRGQVQAQELATWFSDHEPRAVWSSPFRCARETARIALAAAHAHAALIVDERLALHDPSHILHDAGALVEALRGCSYARLAVITHLAVVLALSSILERVPIAGLVNRSRRECAITGYKRDGVAIRRIA